LFFFFLQSATTYIVEKCNCYDALCHVEIF